MQMQMKKVKRGTTRKIPRMYDLSSSRIGAKPRQPAEHVKGAGLIFLSVHEFGGESRERGSPVPRGVFCQAVTAASAVVSLSQSKEMPMKSLRSTFVCLALMSAAAIAHADAVTDWNRISMDVLQSLKVTAVNKVSRTLSMVHVAVFDAINSIQHRYAPLAMTTSAPAGASPEAAAAAAARTMLLQLHPDQKAMIEEAYPPASE